MVRAAQDAIGHIKRAMRLNPQYPFFYLWTLGHAYYLTERNTEAIATFKQLVARNPNFVPAHAFLAASTAGKAVTPKRRPNGPPPRGSARTPRWRAGSRCCPTGTSATSRGS